MIIIFKNDAPAAEAERIADTIERQGLTAVTLCGSGCYILGVPGNDPLPAVAENPWIDRVIPITDPYMRVNRLFHPDDSVISVGGVEVGAEDTVRIIGGPCSVESRESLLEIARSVKAAGASMLRGGAYKPRTSPYAFQGMASEGIRILAEARRAFGLPVVSELMSIDRLDEFVENVDLIQVGARNMQNFDLLRALSRVQTPVLLKRGLSSTVEEWLMAAEYIVAGGNSNVILCERGIRTFEPGTRNTLDLSSIPAVKRKSHLPVIVDPSHATGDWHLVESMSLAAIAAGADGLMIEVHCDPAHARSDGGQSLKPERFASLVEKGRAVARAIGKDIL